VTQRLHGKIAILSGGSGGMALAHTRALVREGARVVSFDVNDGQGARLADELGADRAVFVTGSVTSAEDWEHVVTVCTQRFGSPNVLINNAGISPLQSLEKVSEADYRKVIDINQVGTFLGMRAVVPVMRDAGGSIINIASSAAIVGFGDLFAYVASKWAVRGMTRAAALELAQYRIRVNTICPGDTDTPMTRVNLGTETAALPPAEELPMGRWAQPEEISGAVVFLASEESSYMSGSDVVIDGAYTAQ
jgi:3alpha(or 20beta)-hydroxysteroid dehydrogenase